MYKANERRARSTAKKRESFLWGISRPPFLSTTLPTMQGHTYYVRGLAFDFSGEVAQGGSGTCYQDRPEFTTS